jgi:hypothetical protein
MTTMGRAIVSFLFLLIVAGVLAGIGAQVYQAGVVQGIVDAGRFPAGATVPIVGGYGHHGFDFLGILFPILFLFLIFGILRAAFSHGRGWDRRYGRGYGWGGGWDKGDGPDAPMSWREERDRRMADMHQRLHETDAGAGPGPATGSPGNPGGSATS